MKIYVVVSYTARGDSVIRKVSASKRSIKAFLLKIEWLGSFWINVETWQDGALSNIEIINAENYQEWGKHGNHSVRGN